MEREQFIALISEEQESLRRFLLALCEGDRMEAEDIAQEAMVKAYIAMERFVEHRAGGDGEGVHRDGAVRGAGQVLHVAVQDRLQHLPRPPAVRVEPPHGLGRGGADAGRPACRRCLPIPRVVRGHRHAAAEGEERHPAVLRQRLLREGDRENHGRFPIGCETAAFKGES